MMLKGAAICCGREHAATLPRCQPSLLSGDPKPGTVGVGDRCNPDRPRQRLNLKNMVDTGVRDATAHGPAFGLSISTGGPFKCEAPRAKMRAAAESSETFIAPTSPLDSS